MTLEQRIEALELAIANMAIQRQVAESATMIANKAIADALRPGGVLYAAQRQAAGKKESIYVSKFRIMD